MADAAEPSGTERIELVDRETSRYIGPAGEAEFLATAAMRGGQIVRRAGRVVEEVDASTIHWTGARAGAALSDPERERILDAIRRHYVAEGGPYQIRLSSGVLEDETGRQSPGFRSALPRAEHSDGWSVVDLWMTPQYPDPDDYPSSITYEDPDGAAEMPRRIEVRGDRRLRVLVPSRLHWVGDRAGELMADSQRDRIVGRVKSVYDEWGYRYELAPD